MSRLLILSLAVTVLSGCGGGGPTRHQVSGKVSVKGGGPVKQGVVQFTSKEFTGSGPIAADGTYALSSVGDKDGVPAGKYKVVFSGTNEGGGYNPDGPSPPEVKVIADKYSDPNLTDITADVPDGKYDFELDAP